MITEVAEHAFIVLDRTERTGSGRGMGRRPFKVAGIKSCQNSSSPPLALDRIHVILPERLQLALQIHGAEHLLAPEIEQFVVGEPMDRIDDGSGFPAAL